MKYLYSHLDEENLKWFLKDMSCSTLASIKISRGSIRGLHDLDITFKYPISVIAGINGSGKSTILAIAACAYHNMRDGFRLPGRRMPYYTMSDFFIQSVEEVPPEGIKIMYEFLHNNWRRSSYFPEGVGRGWQSRTKKQGGKWSAYSRRVKRNVVFFGIERVVPHSERSVSKSYRHYFKLGEESGFENNVKDVVGKILGRRYDRFWFREHTKYRLPHVEKNNTVYSGFNMGAGENALFEIFSTIYAAPKGLLIIADEIELGLHESAQRKFIQELKVICKDRHTQIICTTHSPAILAAVPPEGRFFIERHSNRTSIISEVSEPYATGILAEQNSQELDIFVEDGIAQQLVQSVLGTQIRRRVNILPIGSANAIVRQMAARYKDKGEGECIAVLDGDQHSSARSHSKYFLNMIESDENEEAQKWFESRIIYLPGDSWPERWIFTQLSTLDTNSLAESFKLDDVEFQELCDQALDSGKHNEFHSLAEGLSLSAYDVSCRVCHWVVKELYEEFNEVNDWVKLFIK